MWQYMDVGNFPVHWRDYGGSGQLLVLVHGLGGSTINWDVIGPLLAENHHVVALDLPGFGLTPPAGDYKLETHVAILAEFIECFDEPAHLIGNSLGGLLSEMLAASRPDLVRSLVLVAPATPPRLPDPSINWSTVVRLGLNATPGIGVALNRYLVRSRTSAELISESLERITHRASHVPLDVVHSLVRMAETRRSYPWATLVIPKTGQKIRDYFAKPSRFVRMIRDVKAPTLVVQGIADPIVSPTSIRWMCSLRPDWKLVQMEDTGHTPQIDAPIRLMTIVGPWLESRQNHLLSA